jgi:hypothetical protein
MKLRTAFLAFLVLAPNDGGAGGGAGGAGGGGGAGAGGGTGGGSGEGGGGQALTWDAFHGGLNDEQKALLESHTSGLKSALQSERGTRTELEKQIRDLATKAAQGSEAQKQLTSMADQLKTGEKQTAFYEAVNGAGVRNLKLAWAAANSEPRYWKQDGSLDLDGFKKDFPELFATTTTSANAGAGAGQGGGGGFDMNAAIRRAAGRN